MEVLNTNATRYGGNGEGNKEVVKTDPIPWNGRPCSINFTLPGMSTVYFLPLDEVAPTSEPAGAPATELQPCPQAGGAGDSPAPPGDPPGGMVAAPHRDKNVPSVSRAPVIPSGGSPVPPAPNTNTQPTTSAPAVAPPAKEPPPSP